MVMKHEKRTFVMISRIMKIAAVVGLLLTPAAAYADMPNPGNSYQSCPPGAHAQTFPNGNGYRCVEGE
jgi:hypothetical protein